jgi:oligopeptide/dipeptide ABC transporter ATP-binding protein
MPLLEIEDLVVEFALSGRRYRVLDGVSMELESGGTLGIVGESGSGKSMLLRTIMHVLPPKAVLMSGRISYAGEDVTYPGRSALGRIRGREIGMVLQDPMTALNPVLTVEQQIVEAIRATRGMKGIAARSRAIQLLRMVEIADPQRIMRAYPYQLSGGLAQRVSIAIAISAEPRILLADEPTTALDVTVQAQILRLLTDLRERLQMALVLVSHDMAVVAQACAQVAVMYAGSFVERGATTVMFEGPRHPYTVGLLASIPRIDAGVKAEALRAIPGSPPTFGDLPVGCRFEPRCPLATEECGRSPVPLARVTADHDVACLHHATVAERGVLFGTSDQPALPQPTLRTTE